MKEETFVIEKGSRAFVTGATGFLGSCLIRKLVSQGVRVCGLARSPERAESLRDLPVDWIYGDICDESVVKKGVLGASYVFHMATTYRHADLGEAVDRKVHVLGTQLVAKAACEEKAFKRFIHVSTIGVHGHIKNPPADENTPFHPEDAYQRTKAEAELWILDFSRKNNLPLTVVRPSAIYGPGDRRLLKIFQMTKRGWFPVVGKGNNLLHLIHVEDLTDCMILMATHPQALGEVFICAGEKYMTLREMVLMISHEYETKVRFIPLPAAPTFALAHLCEIVCRLFGISPPLFRRRIAFYTKDRAFNNRKMREVLGFTPRYSNENGIRELANWYMEHGWIGKNERMKAELRRERISSEVHS